MSCKHGLENCKHEGNQQFCNDCEDCVIEFTEFEPKVKNPSLHYVKNQIEMLIAFEENEIKDKPWIKQGQYRISGLWSALDIIEKKIKEL